MWFDFECPISQDEQTWIERSMRWLIAEFGEDALRGPMVLPTDEFFPGAYVGSAEDVQRTIERLCVHMSIDPGRVELDFVVDDDHELLASLPAYVSTFSGAAGHYQCRDGRAVVAIRSSLTREPMALAATIAHELGHERLLGEGRISSEQADHEPLTDLLTVFFGLGIFTANAATEFTQLPGGWQARRLGYLTEPMLGYALAFYSWLRNDREPQWLGYLDTNPRTYMKKGLRYLDNR